MTCCGCWRNVSALSFLLCFFFGEAVAQEPLISTISLESADTVDPDDLCFLRTSKQSGVIIVSDKSANAVFLFDDSGKQLDRITIPKPGNIDARDQFRFRGAQMPIIIVNQREPEPQLRALTVVLEHNKPRLRLLNSEMPSGPNYGGCLYQGRAGRTYFFSTTEGGLVQQFDIRDEDGTIRSRRVRSWKSSICEGAVADDVNRVVFVGEENVGIRKLGAEPEDPATGDLIVRVGEHGVTGDIEGITLLPTGKDTGYLIASDQDRNCFIVLDRKSPHRFLGEFKVDGAKHTDGVDLTTLGLGVRFPEGAFGCHTDAGVNKKILLVPLSELLAQLRRF